MKGGYQQIAEIFYEKHGVHTYPLVVQAQAGIVTKVFAMNGGMLGKWRRALRQAVMCTGMLCKPADSARLASAGGDEWTDVRCVSELHAMQTEFGL
eukprot:8284864-Heterocapsa_arctica.AAC.1